MENQTAVTNPPTNGKTDADAARKARAEKYEAIKIQIEDLDKDCADTRKIIYDLRRLLRQ